MVKKEKWLRVAISDDARDAYRRSAKSTGLTLSEWTRTCLDAMATMDRSVYQILEDYSEQTGLALGQILQRVVLAWQARERAMNKHQHLDETVAREHREFRQIIGAREITPEERERVFTGMLNDLTQYFYDELQGEIKNAVDERLKEMKRNTTGRTLPHLPHSSGKRKALGQAAKAIQLLREAEGYDMEAVTPEEV